MEFNDKPPQPIMQSPQAQKEEIKIVEQPKEERPKRLTKEEIAQIVEERLKMEFASSEKLTNEFINSLSALSISEL